MRFDYLDIKLLRKAAYFEPKIRTGENDEKLALIRAYKE